MTFKKFRLDFDHSIQLLFTGCVLSLVAVVAVIYFLMNSIADIANHQDSLRSARAVEAAMAGEREKLAGVLLDNAAWSDAVEHVYGRPDADWLQRTWGNAIGQGNYDMALLLDTDGATLWSKGHGGVTGRAFEDAIGASGAAFVKTLPRDGAAIATVQDAFYFNDQLLVVGAAPVVPETESDTPPVSPARFLVYAKIIDRQALAKIGDKVVVSDLHLADATPGDDRWSFSTVRNNAGEALAFAVWHDQRSGDIARRAVEWVAVAAVACLVGCIAWLLYFAWRAVGRLRVRQREKARLLRMIDDMPVAVMTVEPVTLNINYANEASKQLVRSIEHLLPIKADRLLGSSINVFHAHPEHQRRLLADPANLPHNARIRLGPEVIDLKISAVTDDDGCYLGPMLNWAVVTRQVAAENRIQQLARFDTLTGLANRATFGERLDAALGLGPVGLLYIDLDGFKQVNDTKGHRVGDTLLVQVADRLRGVCDEERMTLARLGGDEFALIVPQADVAGLERLSADIIAALSAVYTLGEHYQALIGVSIGIARGPEHGDNSEALLTRADIALYAAKGAGKGVYRVFAFDMENRLHDRVCLLTLLRDALQTGQTLFVFYQPIVDMHANRITTREALIRWYQPERGWIPPVEFIPIAEQSSLIGPLGSFVLKTACRDAAGWADGARVAVNVSAAQLGKGTFVAEVAAALAESGLAPDRLEIEVTETAMINGAQDGIDDLRRVREMGVRVALDDFGTGYSSLSHLRLFPFDKIKIDGSFVKDAVEHPDSAAIVRAIADLGRRLGVTTVAEGVETEAHLAQVLEEGCTEVQGYYYGRPAPRERDAARVAALNGAVRTSPAAV